MQRYVIFTIAFLVLLSTAAFAKTVKRYYPDGTLEAVVHFDKKGVRNGPYKTYWPNGKLKEKGVNKNGQQVGVVKQWDMDGNPVE